MQKIKDWMSVAAILLLFPYLAVLFSGARTEMQGAGEGNCYKETGEYTGNYYIFADKETAREKMDLETYVEGAAAAVLSADCEPEMMKAQIVLIRTNVVRQIREGTSEASFLAEKYTDPESLRRRLGDSFEAFFRKLAGAASATRGWILTYEGAPVEAAYHLVSNGRTRRGSDVLKKEYPYLQPVESAGDIYSEDYFLRKEIPEDDWRGILEEAGYAPDEMPEILSRDDSGYVSQIALGDHILSGEAFRRLFDLNSADFSIEEGENGKIVTTKGVGHGLGMSQYGANELARQGEAYEAILALYFPGTELKKIE